MNPPPVIATLADLLDRVPDLRGAWITNLDLRSTMVDWPTTDVTAAAFGGCQLTDELEHQLRNAGASVLPPIDSVGFSPYRGALYTNAELMSGYEAGHPETTLDARISATCTGEMTPLLSLARGIHDACIDAALQRFLGSLGTPIVGVMGSHEVGRDDPNYREVAVLGRLLTRAGFVVATGGGPGLMEAANLGAWFADAPDGALAEAFDVLARAPRYETDMLAYLDCALEVRSRWPDGAASLGVPTWLYVEEPLNQFSTWIAKYFQNSVRENGLLAIALGGVIFAPGGSGTSQEIFTDAAQNDYTLYGVRSPMVLMGADHYAHEPQLVGALRSTAKHGGWEHLVRVVDGAVAAVTAIQELVSPEVVPPRPPLRRR
jgi:predicted Rossmann-fold nucleotide-binding protein